MASFKIDTANLPKLASRGDNFTEWRAAWTIALKHAGVHDCIKNKRITDLDETKDTQAMMMILTSVHSDHQAAITQCVDAYDAWKYLSDRFDRDTGNNYIYLFRSLTNLRYKDGDDLQRHVDDFHQIWIKLQKKSSTSTNSVATAMKAMLES